MNVKRLIKKPPVSKTKVRITSFENGLNLTKSENLTPLSSATNLYNFNHSTGALSTGLGISDFLSSAYLNPALTSLALENKSVIGVYYSKKYDFDEGENKDRLALLFDNFKMASLPLNPSQESSQNMLNQINDLTFSSVPTSVNYRLNGEDVTIFTSKTDNMAVWSTNNGVYKVLDAPKIASSCIHYERLFATVNGEQTSVWFSDDLDPTNWSISLTEAGFIDMPDERGASKKVVSFNDYVYVFRDYGIARISAYGDQTNFSVAQLFVSSGKILTNTVVLCGDIILFLATDGLYKFDGINCVKILTNIAPGFIGADNENAHATYFENKYYLACKFNFSDLSEMEESAETNAIIEIDLKTMKVNFLRGVEVKSLCAINCDFFRGVLACVKTPEDDRFKLGVLDNSGAIFNCATNKLWESPLTDLGLGEKNKVLRELFCDSKTPSKLTVINEEGESVSLILNGQNRSEKFNLRFKFRKLKIKIESQEKNCEISCPYCLIKLSEVVS